MGDLSVFVDESGTQEGMTDYLCAIELAAVKYEHGEQTGTDVRFFGVKGSFKKNWLKQARRKLLI